MKRSSIRLAPIPIDCLKLIERTVEPRKVNLKAAPVIVAGGGGMGSEGKLQADPRAGRRARRRRWARSRAAVDAGFISTDTRWARPAPPCGPKLYIACGISGAVQHRAGMEESAKIIAINTDPEAPIFEIAHYGIVGDVREVIPKLIKAFKGKL